MTNSQTKISTFYYNKSGNFCLIVCHEALFNWKLFKLGSVSVKDIRKNVPISQVGGSSHVPSTPPVVWVVLLHKRAGVQSFLSTTVRMDKKDPWKYYEIEINTCRSGTLRRLWHAGRGPRQLDHDHHMANFAGTDRDRQAFR